MLNEIEGDMEMSFRNVFDVPTHWDEVEPTGDKWVLEALLKKSGRI